MKDVAQAWLNAYQYYFIDVRGNIVLSSKTRSSM